MNKTICLNSKYSTTQLLTTEKPEIVNNPGDKFGAVLFLPEGERRKGEGGLRTKGYFKRSFEGKPLISVITVVYNGEKYLEETILSVINQTYDNVEYIIIDGGSTDGTLDIIKKYKDKIDYWISEKDKGIYDAMNKGIDVASGEWLNFMNAGDKLVDRNVLIKIFEQPVFNMDFIYGDTVEINEKNEKFYKKSRNINFFWYGMPTHHQSMFYKNEIIKRKKIKHNLRYKNAGDYDFTIRYLKYSQNNFYYNKPISIFLQGGFSEKNAKLGMEEHIDIKRNSLNLNIASIYSIKFIQKFMLVTRKNFTNIYNLIKFKKYL